MWTDLYMKFMKWIASVTGPRNGVTLTILWLTPEIRCDFTGSIPLFNLGKKYVLDKLNRTQLEEHFGDKHVIRCSHLIVANHLSQSWFNASQTLQCHHMVVKNRNRKGKKSIFERKAIDGCIFLPFLLYSLLSNPNIQPMWQRSSFHFLWMVLMISSFLQFTLAWIWFSRRRG